jgi:hypothetical protein
MNASNHQQLKPRQAKGQAANRSPNDPGQFGLNPFITLKSKPTSFNIGQNLAPAHVAHRRFASL